MCVYVRILHVQLVERVVHYTRWSRTWVDARAYTRASIDRGWGSSTCCRTTLALIASSTSVVNLALSAKNIVSFNTVALMCLLVCTHSALLSLFNFSMRNSTVHNSYNIRGVIIGVVTLVTIWVCVVSNF